MINAAKLGDRFHFGSIKLVKKGDESDHIRDLRFDIPPVFMPFKDDKPSVAPEDGILVTLEDANGNTLVLPTKTLRLKSLPAQYDRIKVVQTVDGVQKTLDVEGFVFFRIPRKQDPVQANNVGNKFNNELNRIFATLELTDYCQIMDIRTVGNGPKILSRSFYLEDTPQYKPLFEQKQSDLVKKDSIEPVYSTVEQNPMFVGGMDSLFRFLGRNIQYPAEARQLKAEGTVYVGFIVEKDGSITNVKTKRNLPESVIDTVKIISVEGGLTGSKIVKRQDHSCEKEAIRVISLMPKWNPGKTNGVPVRAAFTLPIKFRLD